MQQVLRDMVTSNPDRGQTAESVADWLTAGEGSAMAGPATSGIEKNAARMEARRMRITRTGRGIRQRSGAFEDHA